jgi:predicted nucleic acid-binding Zn ribbon protein
MANTLEDIVLERVCEYCGTPIEGRADKRLCNKICGVNFDREETKLESYMKCFAEALLQNGAARNCLDIQELRHAQANIIRYACFIIEILGRRANTSPLVNRVGLVLFKDAAKKYLLSWTNRFDGYMEYANEIREPAINKYVDKCGD